MKKETQGTNGATAFEVVTKALLNNKNRERNEKNRVRWSESWEKKTNEIFPSSGFHSRCKALCRCIWRSHVIAKRIPRFWLSFWSQLCCASYLTLAHTHTNVPNTDAERQSVENQERERERRRTSGTKANSILTFERCVFLWRAHN